MTIRGKKQTPPERCMYYVLYIYIYTGILLLLSYEHILRTSCGLLNYQTENLWVIRAVCNLSISMAKNPELGGPCDRFFQCQPLEVAMVCDFSHRRENLKKLQCCVLHGVCRILIWDHETCLFTPEVYTPHSPLHSSYTFETNLPSSLM